MIDLRPALPRLTASVQLLLAICCPAAVAGGDALASAVLALPAAVPAVVVDSVNAHSDRTLSHVVEEGCERSSPSLADEYSTRPVLVKRGMPRVVTSADHGFPGVVNRRLAHAVRAIVADDSFSMEAPAAQRRAGFEGRRRHGADGAAVAFAYPEGTIAGFGVECVRQNTKSSEAFSGKVFREPVSVVVDSPAAATAGHSANQIRGYDFADAATVASARPSALRPLGACELRHRQPAKPHSAQVMDAGGLGGMLALSHGANLLAGLLVVRAGRRYSACPARLILSLGMGAGK